jgi:UDP-N-acetylenolpyruvoylglucosamine reductase
MPARPSLAPTLRNAGVSEVFAADDARPLTRMTPFDTSIRYAPDAVVAARSALDVERVVAVAAQEGVPVHAFGTGHGTPDHVSGGILLATGALASVDVDIERRTARVGAGTTWAQVLASTTPHGLAGLCGAAPGVGVVGYLLGGGLGPMAREYGFAADHVRSVEVVTPAHGSVTATRDEHADLFWALRGGKGGLGVVTAVTIDLLPRDRVYGGGLFFAADAARDVLTAVAGWAPRLPESSTASVAMLRLPDVPEVPAPIRGRFVVHVRFVSTAAPERARALVEPVRALAKPLVDTIGELPYARIGEVHGDPAHPLPVMCGSVTLDSVDLPLVDAVLDVAGPERDVPVAAVELRALGGALAREPEVPSAVGGRDAGWNLFATAAPVPGLAPEVGREHVRRVLGAAGPRRAPVGLVNFLGRANDADDLRSCWTSEQLTRLDAVRRDADPDGLTAFGGDRPDRP